VGEVLGPALDRIATGDQARAYSAWARAVGEPVTKGTRAKAFSRGRLTVECASSVWANELMYLGPQILRRMDEVAPGHPVKEFRFIVGRLPGPPAEVMPGSDEVSAPAGPTAVRTAASRQESGSAGTKRDGRAGRPSPAAFEAAHAEATEVRDPQLRAAIEAALWRSSGGSPQTPGDSAFRA